MSSLVDNGNIIIRTIVPQVSAITSRKGNPISRRTLRFLLVCKVIGSPSRSRFARESSIFYRSGRGTLLRERHDSAITRCQGLPFREAIVRYLLIEYLRIDSVIESLSRRRSLPTTFTPSGRTRKLPCIYATRFSCQWRRLRGTYGKINLVSTVDR